MNPSDYYKHEARTVAVAMRELEMTRLEALERKYREMNIDEMTLVELKQARANMRGWMEAVIAESGARGVVEIGGTERLPSLYDMAAVEFALRQVETEIAWRELGGEG